MLYLIVNINRSGDFMEQFIIEIMNSWGYLGIAFLIAIENVFPPIPSEVILTFGGFSTTITDMSIYGVIISATIGSVIGALILYLIGYFLNEERLNYIVNSKLGKILRIKSSDIEKAKKWFDLKGKYTVFFCRFVPIVRSLISIPAGMAKMKLPLFLILTTIGSLIWNIVLVLLGSFAGGSWEKIADYVSKYSKITLIVLILLFLVGTIIFYINKAKKTSKSQ